MKNFSWYMGLVLVGVIIPIVWAIFAVWREDFGNESGRKIQILSIFLMCFLGCLYGFVGFFQICITERREKFIVWRAIINSEQDIELDGLFSKQDRFSKKDIATVDKYQFKKKLSELGTLLDWRSGVYVLKLKNGHIFFFSKGLMEEIIPFISTGIDGVRLEKGSGL